MNFNMISFRLRNRSLFALWHPNIKITSVRNCTITLLFKLLYRLSLTTLEVDGHSIRTLPIISTDIRWKIDVVRWYDFLWKLVLVNGKLIIWKSKLSRRVDRIYTSRSIEASLKLIILQPRRVFVLRSGNVWHSYLRIVAVRCFHFPLFTLDALVFAHGHPFTSAILTASMLSIFHLLLVFAWSWKIVTTKSITTNQQNFTRNTGRIYLSKFYRY